MGGRIGSDIVQLDAPAPAPASITQTHIEYDAGEEWDTGRTLIPFSGMKTHRSQLSGAILSLRWDSAPLP